MTPVPVLILHAPGTNRDGDAACAVQLAGGDPCIVPLTQLRQEHIRWLDYGMLVLPGGFSYGDALGAGRLLALDLQTWFADQLNEFVRSGRPVIGICNGFQALVKAGVLPGSGQAQKQAATQSAATLTFNASGRFECRWVRLLPQTANPSPWLAGLGPIFCPVAHGEGRFLTAGAPLPQEQIALTYITADGAPANEAYPANPNGSPGDIAGITNAAGNVLGLMPHPEDYVLPHQHPYWSRLDGEETEMGLPLFQNGIRMTKS